MDDKIRLFLGFPRKYKSKRSYLTGAIDFMYKMLKLQEGESFAKTLGLHQAKP